MGYSFRLTARVLLYASSHRQDNTYHSLCYTSRGALAGTRNSSMGPLHEGSIRRPIAPWANALTTELHLAPLSCKVLPPVRGSGWEGGTPSGRVRTSARPCSSSRRTSSSRAGRQWSGCRTSDSGNAPPQLITQNKTPQKWQITVNCKILARLYI